MEKRAVVKGQSSKRQRGGGRAGEAGAEVEGGGMPGGCSQSPLPGPKLTWRGGLWLDSTPGQVTISQAPDFSFLSQSKLYDLGMHLCADFVDLSSPGRRTFPEGRVSSISVAFTPGLGLRRYVQVLGWPKGSFGHVNTS